MLEKKVNPKDVITKTLDEVKLLIANPLTDIVKFDIDTRQYAGTGTSHTIISIKIQQKDLDNDK
jgi:hypothetical protein